MLGWISIRMERIDEPTEQGVGGIHRMRVTDCKRRSAQQETQKQIFSVDKALHYRHREISSSVRLWLTTTLGLSLRSAVGRWKISGQGRTRNMTPLVGGAVLHGGMSNQIFCSPIFLGARPPSYLREEVEVDALFTSGDILQSVVAVCVWWIEMFLVECQF